MSDYHHACTIHYAIILCYDTIMMLMLVHALYHNTMLQYHYNKQGCITLLNVMARKVIGTCIMMAFNIRGIYPLYQSIKYHAFV